MRFEHSPPTRLTYDQNTPLYPSAELPNAPIFTDQEQRYRI